MVVRRGAKCYWEWKVTSCVRVTQWNWLQCRGRLCLGVLETLLAFGWVGRKAVRTAIPRGVIFFNISEEAIAAGP